MRGTLADVSPLQPPPSARRLPGSWPSPAPEERIVLDPHDRRDAVLQVIHSARERLALSLFRCTDPEIREALDDTVRRGVSVDVLVTDRATNGGRRRRKLASFLTRIGADVRRYGDPLVIYHAKFIVADEDVAVITSLNLTPKCLEHTCDFLLVTEEAAVVRGLLDLFDADRRAPGTAWLDGLPDRLIVGPEHARERFASLLGRARRRIRLVDPKLTDDSMIALLRARAASGVRVEVATGGTARLRPHGKLLIIDDELAVVGSLSLSRRALDERRELAIVTRDRSVVRELADFFDELGRIDG